MTLNTLRLQHGLYWPTSRPPLKKPLLTAAAIIATIVLTIIAIHYITKANTADDLAASLEPFQKVVIDCANQATRGGTMGLTFDNKLIGVECSILSEDAYGGVKRYKEI